MPSAAPSQTTPSQTTSPPGLAPPDNLRGLLLMGLGFLLFSIADTQAKLLTEWFHPVQIVWSRQVGLLSGVAVALLLMVLALMGMGWLFRPVALRQQ